MAASLDQKVTQYEGTIKQYIARPESRRQFNDVFNDGLELVREHGRGFQFLLFGSKTFRYEFPDTSGYYDGITLKYRRITFFRDELAIQYQRYEQNSNDHQPSISLEEAASLLKQRPKSPSDIALLERLRLQATHLEYKDRLPNLMSNGLNITLKRLMGHELLSDLDGRKEDDLILRGKTIFSRKLFEMGPLKSVIYDHHRSVVACREF